MQILCISTVKTHQNFRIIIYLNKLPIFFNRKIIFNNIKYCAIIRSLFPTICHSDWTQFPSLPFSQLLSCFILKYDATKQLYLLLSFYLIHCYYNITSFCDNSSFNPKLLWQLILQSHSYLILCCCIMLPLDKFSVSSLFTFSLILDC